jgi:UDP-N-acetylglucosamine transferase subunit ALG13
MIFVTVGTNEARFDRLLNGVAGIPPGEEMLVQHGPSPVRPTGATCVDYLSFDDLVGAVRRARVVITHAGVGSIMAAVANGKRPVVVPRLARHGEAVDDHQLPLARRLATAGLVTLLEDPAGLPSALETDRSETTATIEMDRRLVQDLRSFLLTHARPRGDGAGYSR